MPNLPREILFAHREMNQRELVITEAEPGHLRRRAKQDNSRLRETTFRSPLQMVRNEIVA